MPEGAKALSAESWGISAWTKTAKISVSFPTGRQERFFLKVRILNVTSIFQNDTFDCISARLVESEADAA
jgi:hypothetical protein